MCVNGNYRKVEYCESEIIYLLQIDGMNTNGVLCFFFSFPSLLNLDFCGNQRLDVGLYVIKLPKFFLKHEITVC